MENANKIIPPPSDSLLLNNFKEASQSVLMQDFYEKILHLAKNEKDIVIIGEIGSGKKRVAKIIHANSNRANKPFYSFYCMDVDENEYRDAFWEKLRFERNHIRLEYEVVEKVDGGVLYLDKFSSLPRSIMIDIIESYVDSCNQLYKHIKSERPRLIVSLNQESFHQILDSPVWDTLLEKLDPIAIMVPPLRERKEDIPVFIELFLDQIRRVTKNSESLSISDQALEECLNYSWPGNIRQLKNAMYHAAILSQGKKIESEHLPFSMKWTLPYEIEDQKKSMR